MTKKIKYYLLGFLSICRHFFSLLFVFVLSMRSGVLAIFFFLLSLFVIFTTLWRRFCISFAVEIKKKYQNYVSKKCKQCSCRTGTG